MTAEAVEVFRNPSPTGYLDVDRHTRGGHLKPLLVPEVEVDPGELFGA